MISSVVEVRGPFHSSQSGLGSFVGRLWRMSAEDRRCGSFEEGIVRKVVVWSVHR